MPFLLTSSVSGRLIFTFSLSLIALLLPSSRDLLLLAVYKGEGSFSETLGYRNVYLLDRGLYMPLPSWSTEDGELGEQECSDMALHVSL